MPVETMKRSRREVKPAFVSHLLSARAAAIFSWLHRRYERMAADGRAASIAGLPIEQLLRKYRNARERADRVVELARHKYPHVGPNPDWVSAGSLD